MNQVPLIGASRPLLSSTKVPLKLYTSIPSSVSKLEEINQVPINGSLILMSHSSFMTDEQFIIDNPERAYTVRCQMFLVRKAHPNLTTWQVGYDFIEDLGKCDQALAWWELNRPID